MRTFFAEPDKISDQWIELDPGQLHHARDVLRLKPGEPVRVTDGRGAIYQGVLDPAGGRIRVEHVTQAAAFRCEVNLGIALLKGDRWDWLLEKAVEIGVARIVPLMTSHGVVRLEERDFEKKKNRWRQVMISALKQSGQGFLPCIEPPSSVPEFCSASAPARSTVEGRWVLSEKGGTQLKTVLRPDLKRVTVMVGPEGGWCDLELELALEYSFQPVNLGRQILRAETAALYALSVIRFVTE